MMDKVELKQEEMEDSIEVSWTENPLRSMHVSGCGLPGRTKDW